jgi:hypothetical protein
VQPTAGAAAALQKLLPKYTVRVKYGGIKIKDKGGGQPTAGAAAALQKLLPEYTVRYELIIAARIKEEGSQQLGRQLLFKSCCLNTQCGLNMAARIKEEDSQQLWRQLLFKSCRLNTQCRLNLVVLKSGLRRRAAKSWAGSCFSKAVV